MNYLFTIILFLLYLIIIFLNIANIDQLFYSNNVIKNNIININDFCGHLGDQIYITYYFNSIKNYLEENNIIINYYVNSIYHKQMCEFLQTSNIILYNYKPIGLNVSLSAPLHLNLNLIYNIIQNRIFGKRLEYDKYYINFFNYISDIIKIPIKINKFEYKNNNLLLKYNKLPEKYKNIDILIINSIPRTFQYIYNIEEWNNFIIKLNNENFKIITTYKVPNINCTLDDNLSLFNIAAISTHSKIIIAINTGPTSTLFNEDTLNYTRKIYLFDYNITYCYKNVININNIKDIDINELHKIFAS